MAAVSNSSHSNRLAALKMHLFDLRNAKMTKEKTDNLSLWEGLQATDPKYTKQFKGAGGFSGTAINGTYILKRLTEAFGACGKGWKFVLDDEQIVEGHTLKGGDKSKLHIVRGHLEYLSAGAWHSTSPQFGQTMLVGENKNGTFTDEEAPKKSITDCISKCAVLLGIAADVHLGLFDDNKYVNTRKAEEAAAAAPAGSAAGQPVLDDRAPSPKPAEASPANTTDDMTIARSVFSLVKATAESAKDMKDIDDCLKHNKASLAVLERASPLNYAALKSIVTDAGAKFEPKNDPAMNDDIPNFEDMGRA